MKILIVGLGNQGKKRINYFNKKFLFASFDPYNKNADFQKLYLIPLDKFDSVFICTPDEEKYELIKYFLDKKKNTFVEKPLYLGKRKINQLYKLANLNKCILYTAYNHRFEPNLIRLKKELKFKENINIYYAKLFYGNGTAIDVKKSKWRDKKLGVISDLLPHLIDILLFTLGDKKISNLKIHKVSSFENKSYDHAIISFLYSNIYVDMEISLCSWKNNFKYDLYSNKFSFHIDSLNKWGSSSFIKYLRKLPSGIPKKNSIKSNNTKDPTWNREHLYLIKNTNATNTLINEESRKRDLFVSELLDKIKERIL